MINYEITKAEPQQLKQKTAQTGRVRFMTLLVNCLMKLRCQKAQGLCSSVFM